MPEKSLTGKSIKNSYEGLLHLNNGGLATGGLTLRKRVYDGIGNTTCLSISNSACSIQGTNDSYVFIGGNSASIELADTSGSNNPYIDFKTSSAGEDYDCRILKTSSDDLEFSTGGNGSTNKIVTMKSTGLLAVQGGLSVRPTKREQCLLNFNAGDYTPTSVRNYITAITPNGNIHNDLGGLFVGCDDNNGDENALLIWNHTGTDLQTVGKAGEIFKVKSNGDTTVGRKLIVKDGLRLKTSGTEAAGKVLTCTNSSGDTEWRDAPGGGSTPYRATHNIGQTYRNNSGGKIMVLATIRSTNDIYGFAIYAGPVKGEVQAVCGPVASINPPYIPNQADSSDIGSVRRLAFSHQVSDSSADDAATITAIIPDDYYYKIAINAGNDVNATQIGSRTYYYDTTEAWQI